MSLSPEEYERILRASMPHTMAPEAAVRFSAEEALNVIDRAVTGSIVECGVWRGGCSIAMLLAQREQFGAVKRKAYLLDSFEGLPPATDRDGPLALAWQADSEGPMFFDNCRASLPEVQTTLRNLQIPAGSYELIQGWFDQTVPALAERLHSERIALLRLDADWYASTMVCLDHLVPIVSDGGVVLLDDYYAWDGCARAVHDFLSHHDLAYRVRSIPDFAGAYFIKRPFRSDANVV
jgi:O-methyltransferase